MDANGARLGGEIRSLTGLRIVAALWVVLIHFQTVVGDGWGGVADALRPVILSGWLGVDLFFVLSGFVLTWSYLDRLGPGWDVAAAGRFLWARLIRIWPLWALLTSVAAAFLAVTGWDQGGTSVAPRVVTWHALAEQLGLVQMWTRQLNLGSSFVAPGWSLSVEVAAYLTFPLVVLLAHRLRHLPVAALVALAILSMAPMALVSYHAGLADFWLPWQGRIAGAFLSGVFTCLAVVRLRADRRAEQVAPVVAVAAVVELGFVVWWSDGRVASGDLDRAGVALVVFPVLVGALALSDRGLSRVMSGPAMVLGGRISFALYLVHCLVLDVYQWAQTTVPLLAPGRPAAELVGANLVLISLALAWVLWRRVEEPARTWLRHRGPGRPPRSRTSADRVPPQVVADVLGRSHRRATVPAGPPPSAGPVTSGIRRPLPRPPLAQVARGPRTATAPVDAARNVGTPA